MSKLIPILFFASAIFFGQIETFCWEPGTTPFNGPPKTTRLPEGDQILVNLFLLPYKQCLAKAAVPLSFSSSASLILLLLSLTHFAQGLIVIFTVLSFESRLQ